jgi:hypothetical protein
MSPIDIDDLEAVRQLPAVAEPSAATRVAAADRLQRRIDASRQPAPRRRRPLALAAVGAALAAAGLIAVATLGGGGGGVRLVAPADAAEALSRVAGVAAGQPDVALAPGQYWYVQDRSRYLTTVGDAPPYSAFGATEVRETWTDRDGNGRYRSTSSGHLQFLGPRDRERWERSGRPALSGRSPGDVETHTTTDSPQFGVGAGTVSYAELAALPTDGAAMYAALRRLAGDAGPSPDEEVFAIIGDLLRNDPVPPEVRAGLYRAAAYIKGIRLIGPVRDSLGRRGVAVELDSSAMRRRLVFDPHTALLLAEQDVLATRVPYLDAAPGTVIGDRLAVRQAIVPTAESRP